MSKLFDDAEEAAAAWDARLRSARATFRDRRTFQLWLQEDERHRLAYDRLQVTLSVLQTNTRLPELCALRDEARDNVRANRRRRFAAVATVAAAAIVLLVLILTPQSRRGGDLPAAAQGQTIYATSPNERTRVTLADGSVVTLDAGTRLAVQLHPSRRDITLLAGQALFQVAKDHTRPFVVRAGDRTVTALGTVFDVRLSSRELRITLAEGTVAVRPVHAGEKSDTHILKPDQQLVETAGAAPELRTVDTERALSWAQDQFFFDNESLASAIDEVNQSSPFKIVVDPAIADLRISGMFRAGNQAEFLDALQVTLPVEAHRQADGRILLSRRVGQPVK